MQQHERQQLLSTLAKSSLADIRRYWPDGIEQHEYRTIRPAQTGMVMAVARCEGDGEPFNLGEVAVTRCALQLPSGETGIGYVMGRNEEHAQTVALIDALAQVGDRFAEIHRDVIEPLQNIQQQKQQQQHQKTAATRVDFFTMVRGED
jgi:alpha-D-ribose 1-methylphosphonate 5-triphosphate synthase subunit PhnG